MIDSGFPDPALDLPFKTERQIVHQALQREYSTQDEAFSYLFPGLDATAPFADIILAVGLPRRDTMRHRTIRCQLAIALETLARAQCIHRFKVVADHPTNMDLVGIAVLMGDHHFARAAQLVTQLANPALLEAFAHVLKMASTQEIASLATGSMPEWSARAALTTYGIQCGTFLSDIDPVEVQRTAAAWQTLATSSYVISAESAIATFLAETPSHQRGRWRTAAMEYLARSAEDTVGLQ